MSIIATSDPGSVIPVDVPSRVPLPDVGSVLADGKQHIITANMLDPRSWTLFCLGGKLPILNTCMLHIGSVDPFVGSAVVDPFWTGWIIDIPFKKRHQSLFFVRQNFDHLFHVTIP